MVAQMKKVLHPTSEAPLKVQLRRNLNEAEWLVAVLRFWLDNLDQVGHTRAEAERLGTGLLWDLIEGKRTLSAARNEIARLRWQRGLVAQVECLARLLRESRWGEKVSVAALKENIKGEWKKIVVLDGRLPEDFYSKAIDAAVQRFLIEARNTEEKDGHIVAACNAVGALYGLSGRSIMGYRKRLEGVVRLLAIFDSAEQVPSLRLSSFLAVAITHVRGKPLRSKRSDVLKKNRLDTESLAEERWRKQMQAGPKAK